MKKWFCFFQLFESRTSFGFAPEVTPMWRCIDQQEYVFKDHIQNEMWCHGHTTQPYHGIQLFNFKPKLKK